MVLLTNRKGNYLLDGWFLNNPKAFLRICKGYKLKEEAARKHSGHELGLFFYPNLSIFFTSWMLIYSS